MINKDALYSRLTCIVYELLLLRLPRIGIHLVQILVVLPNGQHFRLAARLLQQLQTTCI